MRHFAILKSVVLSMALLAAGCGDSGGDGDDDDTPTMDSGTDSGMSDAGPECTTNDDCDDDNFCTGDETCTNGSCASAGDPCTGTFADGGSEELVCDEAMNACVGCVENSDCVEAVPVCFDGMCVECTTTMDDECTGGTPVCDGVAMQCVECVMDDDCSGATPICNDENECEACDADADCTGMTGTEICDEVGGACVECTADGDCAGTDICDTNNVCVPTFEVGGTITGLLNTQSVTLQLNLAGDTVVTETDSDPLNTEAIAFGTRLQEGIVYSVTVSDHPTGHFCAVVEGDGTVGTADVTNLDIQCGSLVFLSNVTSAGDGPDAIATDGVADFDDSCDAQSAAAGADGTDTFGAWLGRIVVIAEGPLARLGITTTARFIRVDGTVVADTIADLTDGTIDAAINVQADGTVVTTPDFVWTGTETDGTEPAATGTCDDTAIDWDTSSNTETGLYGLFTATTGSWTDDNSGVGTCDLFYRFYCFQMSP